MTIPPTSNVSPTPSRQSVRYPPDDSSNSPGSSGEGSASLPGGSSHSGSRSGQARRHSITSRGRIISITLTELLRGLKKFTDDLAAKMVRKNAYVNVDEVEHNATNIRCPAENIVTTTPWLGNGEPINCNLHANEITFKTDSPQEKSKKYIAAQSPIPKKDDEHGFFACEKFLAKAIEDKSGLFQFVSPSRKGESNYISKRSIVGQLKAKWDESGGNLVIGGRYKVTNFDPMETVLTDGTLGTHDSHFIFEVEDTRLGSDAKEFPISIVLTQAQVNFDNKLLSAKGIREASKLMDEHKLRAGTPETGPDAMVISHAGIGRNATLIVYREILGRIKNGLIPNTTQLEKEVIALIEQGRAVRGPQFVHSEEQVCELFKALQEKLPNERSSEELPIDQQPEIQGNNADKAPDLPKPKKKDAVRSIDAHGVDDIPTQSQPEVNTHPAAEVGEKEINSSTEIQQQPPDGLDVHIDSAKDAQIKSDRLMAEKMQDRNVLGDEPIKRTPAGKAFEASRFVRRRNVGGNNCLFHAIAGTQNHVKGSLSDDEMKVLRNRVANVLEKKPDNSNKPNIHYHDYCLTVLSGREPPKDMQGNPIFFNNTDGTITRHVSNAMMAEVQRQLGHIAGDKEIAQWLELEGNEDKTVVVVDEQAGSESIVTFHNGKRKTWELKKHPTLREEDVVQIIRASIATAVAEEQGGVPPSDRTQLAIFRTQGHFEAITGVNNNRVAARSKQKHLADIERQIEMANTVDISNL
ncbi:hypothetical protein [Actimicrobium sp. CCI2.3]|uniref:hypothetical protein n=1 Tax=Actimicrobium sp. CCI2.3 TaxID=3048616 RepID=UPI002AB4BC20|nr:hypothetical protein [Actimicrobium sp. CCI2.3]MDY7573007.1 hypothetical protein [Actimicrobium sp. CCI2.3]MEB0023880.1 hypothetical protein [Actimicrobium sp. CCI2.3]